MGTPQKKPDQGFRLVYIDNLRSFVIALVILAHAAITYSGIGFWFYKEGVEANMDAPELVLYGVILSFVQTWTMSALFFISAYWAIKALKKRSVGAFIKMRAIRLGIPVLFHVFVIAPIIYFVIVRNSEDYGSLIIASESGRITWKYLLENYLNYITTLRFARSTGPLWFSAVLLIFCAAFAIFRHYVPYRKNALMPQDGAQPDSPMKWLETKNMVFIIAAVTAAAFLVRLKFPIGTTVLNLQLGLFPAFVIMFVLGAYTGEHDALDQCADGKNVRWIKVVLLAGIPVWGLSMLFGGAFDGSTKIYFGGWNWQSLAYVIWDTLLGVWFPVGLLAYFKKRANSSNAFSRAVSDNAFGIYVLHSPVITTVTILMKDWAVYSMVKFSIAVILTFFVTMGLSALLRKIKPIGLFLK
jgi:peptidoglycan/LPS O-acetylase OafA/YrhL